MQRNVGIDRAGIEALAQHENSLLMFVSGFRQESDISGQRYIPGDLLPDKLKRIRGEPHIFATSADGVGMLCGIEVHRSRMQDRAHIVVTFEDPDGRWALRRGAMTAYADTTHENRE